MSNTSDAEKATRSRSPAYPLIPLGEAIDAIRKLWEAQRKQEARVDSVLSALGYSSKNGTALRLIAALQQYGLLEGTGSGDNRKLRISESAQDIIHLPPEDERYQKALKAAALAPTIHQILWDRYGKLLPGDGAIKPFLIRNRGFNDTIVDSVIKNYRGTFEYANLATSEKPIDEEKSKDVAFNDVFNNFFGPKPAVSGKQPAVPETKVAPSKEQLTEEDQILPIPVGRNRFAQIPFPMTAADYKMLLGTLRLWEERIVQVTPAQTDHAVRAGRKQLNPESEHAAPSSKQESPLVFPIEVMWRNKDSDMPITIVGIMGEMKGETYYETASGTGIPASQIDWSEDNVGDDEEV